MPDSSPEKSAAEKSGVVCYRCGVTKQFIGPDGKVVQMRCDHDPPEPSPHSIQTRRLIAACLQRTNVIPQMKLDPRRGAQLEAVLDNQALLFHAMAFLLDGMLTAAGETPELKFQEMPEPSGLVAPS